MSAQWCRPGGRAVLAAALATGLVVAAATGAGTQTAPLTGTGSRPTTGGTYSVREPPAPLISGSGNTEILRHRDFAGKPCLAINGFARAYASNANLFDHVIGAENRCPKAIRVQICYFKSTDCVPMDIPGYARKEAILGTMPSQKDFRFEFREKF